MLHFSNGKGPGLVWIPCVFIELRGPYIGFKFHVGSIFLKNTGAITRIYGKERLHVIIQ